MTTYVHADGYTVPPELWSGPYFGAYVGGGSSDVGSSFSQTTVATTNSIVSGLPAGTQSFSQASGKLNGQTTGAIAESMLSIIDHAGFLARPNTMIYGLVGSTEGYFISNNADLFDLSQYYGTSQWTLGVSAGAGLEQKLNKHWSILAEYRYVHFNFNTNSTVASASESQNSSGITAITSNTTTSWNPHMGLNLGKIGIVFRC